MGQAEGEGEAERVLGERVASQQQQQQLDFTGTVGRHETENWNITRPSLSSYYSNVYIYIIMYAINFEYLYAV